MNSLPASSATKALPTGAETTRFRDPNEIAVRQVRIRLLREILDCQRRLEDLLGNAAPDQTTLIDACRRAIRVRRQLLRDLPEVVDREIPAPWREAPGQATPA